MTKSVMRQFLCLVSMLFLCIGNVFSQNVVDLGTDLYSTKYYESMNASNPPSGNWYAVDYDDSSWSDYIDPLDFPEYDAFWVRRTFFLTDEPTHHQFQLDFNIADTVAIVANQEYKIGTGNYKVTLVGPKEAPGEEIPLKGWVKFLQLNPSGRIVEARFELDGKDSSGQDYTLRHGFMRLYKQSPSGE